MSFPSYSPSSTTDFGAIEDLLRRPTWMVQGLGLLARPATASHRGSEAVSVMLAMPAALVLENRAATSLMGWEGYWAEGFKGKDPNHRGYPRGHRLRRRTDSAPGV